MKLELTSVRESVYSATVPVLPLLTSRSERSTARSPAMNGTGMRSALTVDPDVVYSPIPLALSV